MLIFHTEVHDPLAQSIDCGTKPRLKEVEENRNFTSCVGVFNIDKSEAYPDIGS